MVAKGTTTLLLLLAVSAASGQSFSRMNRLSTTKHRWLLKFNNSTSFNNATGELCMGNATYCPDRITLVEDDDEEEEAVGEDDVRGGSETRRNWYESVPMPPIAVATSRTLPEGACKRQLTRYLEALGNGTLWATQMFDASAKYPQGVFDGNTWQLGSFDQCYRIDTSVPAAGENNGVGDVRGRYCLVDFKYEQRDAAPDFQGRLNIDFDPNQSAWEAIREKGDFRRVRRYLLQMALCVPAACSAEDVQMALQGPYADYGMKNNLIIKVDVQKNNCQTYLEEPEFSTGAIVYSSILFGLFALVVISSWYDGTLTKEEEHRGTSAVRQVFLCFSAKRNWRSIFEVSYKHRGLDTIHMIKFFSMCLVLVGHRMMEYYINATVNARHLEMAFNIPSFIVVINGPIIVDGFFGIGGLLTCYGLLHQFATSKRMNFVGLVLIRFLRLTPAYALLVFFQVYLFPHLGSGPQWQSKVVAEADNCAATWWANLFYLNNYFTMDKICIFQSWYLSVDFHCYLLTIVLIYMFSKMPRRIGWSILGSVTFISIAIPFIVTYLYRIQPVFIGYPYLDGLHMDPYFLNYYVKTHLRASSYLVGVICGAILYDYQHATWRISKAMAQGMFILVALTCIYSQSLGYQYFNPNSNPSSLEMALYASLHRAAFSAGFCCIVLLITMGDGLDFHYNFLTPRWVQPLGRLTYSVFLTHNIIQIYDIGTVRSSRAFSIKNAFWNFVPDFFYSFSIALLVALGVEGPFRRLEKFFLTKRVPSVSKHEKETDSCDAKSEETKKID